MRINQFVAHASGLSRRQADAAISVGTVRLNGAIAALGAEVGPTDKVTLDGKPLGLPGYRTILLHKPVEYVTSRRQQGTVPTLYALLPAELHGLKPVGRLDKDSSGLILLTNDGELAQRWQHPSQGKWKRYAVRLDRPLEAEDAGRLQRGVELRDGVSRLQLAGSGRQWVVRLQEGRNRQIRRSFARLGYRVIGLHRTDFGALRLGELKAGKWRELGEAETHEMA